MIRNILYLDKNYHLLKNCLKLSNKIKYKSIHSQEKIQFKTSFAYWILQHFKSDQRYETHFVNNDVNMNSNKIKNILINKTNLESLNTHELLNCILIINNDEMIKNITIFRNVDEEFSRRLMNDEEDYKNINHKDLLKITDSLVYFSHNNIQLINKSYKICIHYFKHILKYHEVSLHHFIQFTFYTSNLKVDPLSREIMSLILSKIHMQTVIFDAITPLQLAIFSNSIYKTSTKIISKKILRSIIEAIEKESHTLFVNSKLCKCILKPLHQAKHHDYSFLKKLSEMIITKKNDIDIDKYPFYTHVSLFKLYANSLHSDENIINFLADSGIIKLNNMYKNKEYIRVKDIAILLKSFCELGTESLKKHAIHSVLPILNEAFDNNEIRRNEQKSFVECILWLNIFTPCHKNFINKVIDKKLIIKGKHKGDIKSLSRMNLLLTILFLEKSLSPTDENELMQLIEETGGRTLESIFKAQPKLYELYQAVQCLAATNKSLIKDINFGCQIPNLFIPGITVFTESCKIAIELLDDKVCLHDTRIPHGYMKLKFRLLKKSGYAILTVPQEIIDEGSAQLLPMVEDSIARIEKHNEFFIELNKT